VWELYRERQNSGMCIHQATTRRPSGKLTITSDRRLQKGYQGIQEESSRLLGKKKERKKERKKSVYNSI
jgi:hypothetical protein